MQSEDGLLCGEVLRAAGPVRGLLVAGHSPRTSVCHGGRCFFLGAFTKLRKGTTDESILRFSYVRVLYGYSGFLNCQLYDGLDFVHGC